MRKISFLCDLCDGHIMTTYRSVGQDMPKLPKTRMYGGNDACDECINDLEKGHKHVVSLTEKRKWYNGESK